MKIAYTLSSSLFAAIFLVALIVYGNDTVRVLAMASAFLGCLSQFIAQDARAWLASITLAYASMIVGLAGLVVYVL